MSKGRVLSENGKWECPRGHDKSVVGVHGSRMCRACYHESNARSRRRKGYARRGYRGDVKEIPNLRKVRTALGLSIRELAEISGVGRTTISEIELGQRKAGYTTRSKLLKVLAPMIRRSGRARTY